MNEQSEIILNAPGLENYQPGVLSSIELPNIKNHLPVLLPQGSSYTKDPSKEIQEYTLDQIKDISNLFAESTYFTDAIMKEQAFVKIMAGRELGMPPMASMREIFIVKGKVSLSAMMIAALIKKSGKYTYSILEHNTNICRIEFFERNQYGKESLGVSSFSMEEAKIAGLTTNNVWQKFSRNMLFSRAMTNGARWHCPDIFAGGVYTPDEIDDSYSVNPDGSIDAEFKVLKPTKSISHTSGNVFNSKDVLDLVEKKPIVPDDKNTKETKDILIKRLEELSQATNYDLKQYWKDIKVSSPDVLMIKDLKDVEAKLLLRQSVLNRK